jgi:BirA family biotin operon repressor/biotin-[acetyl-CoA-carboxylase] ligase
MFPSIIHSYSIIHLQDTDSTNNYTATLEKQSYVQHKTVIMASFQTKGKGQYQNTWVSEPDKNLLLSIYIKPKIKIEEQFNLSRITSLALRDTIYYFLKKKVSIKWPNDIFVDEKKIAGILIENSLGQLHVDRSIIGIGLNVNQEIFSAPNATSLKLESARDWDLNRVLEYLIYRFDHYLEIIGDPKEEILRDFDLFLFGKNEWKPYRSDKLGIFQGKIIGTALNGMLKVEDSAKQVHLFNHKEIDFNSKQSPNDSPSY